MNASFLFDVTAMVRDGRDDPEPVLLPLQQNEYRVIQFCVAMRDTKPDHLGFTKPDHLRFVIIVGKTSKKYKTGVLQFCFPCDGVQH